MENIIVNKNDIANYESLRGKVSDVLLNNPIFKDMLNRLLSTNSPNILINENEYFYIDLGNVSISTKYFDLYVLRKSLIINKLENELSEFLKGYGMEKIEEVYMDWMSLIESSYN